MARSRLPRIAFDFVDGGVDGEEGLGWNAQVFRKYSLLPRYCMDVSKRDQSVTLFGHSYSSPFGICPMGILGLFRHGTDLMLAEAAAAANVPYVMSSTSNASLEEAVKVAPNNTWFQIYTTRDETISFDLIRRAREAGIQNLLITVDVPVSVRRERNMRNGFSRPLRVTPRIALESIAHPGWVYSYFKNGGLPLMANFAPYAKPGATADEVADVYSTQIPNSGQTWSLVENIRKAWPHNLIIKGILHPDDAARAVGLGANGLLVSNHGGRQLDRAPAPIEMLAEIRAAVGDEIPLLVDSGIRRGADIIIARCLGATMGLFGRPAVFGAVAGGVAGVSKVMSILRAQIDTNLGQMGCSRFEDLGIQFLRDRR
ncbi:L-lactate dehydrogenase (cytochrome)/(S)-mandelate dehydrogenase [Rhodoligotrophos appendicifer]|uniref:alpha-hydroxy acid oxidase n=1 Tax=Rhodoligotrophos appendicifer TaxID=987056 RepID=UPI00196106BA|nr:alpha-hydroxy acid oxidase [Rhodoligotrophos appendicifer]